MNITWVPFKITQQTKLWQGSIIFNHTTNLVNNSIMHQKASGFKFAYISPSLCVIQNIALFSSGISHIQNYHF